MQDFKQIMMPSPLIKVVFIKFLDKGRLILSCDLRGSYTIVFLIFNLYSKPQIFVIYIIYF